MKDFFINLETPTLNSNYANSLNELVVNINQNFAKIASLPFLKGDSGVSIEVCDEVFYSDDEEFTPFACAVINAIYGGDIPEYEYKIAGHNSYEDLKNIKTIPVFYDKSQGKKYLTVPFMFHDARKNYLGEVINTEHSMNFVDMSTFVLGSGIYNGTEWVWDMSKHDFEPKLYFNSNTQKFCWAIGSQKTEVIAQGVEGKPGASVYAKYCKGSFSETADGTDQTYIYIDAILNDGSLTGGDQDYNYDISGLINDGDFVMVEFINPVTGGADLSFGKVFTVGDNKCIPYFANTTLSGVVNNITLKSLLDQVGKNISDDVDGVRGLYVYEKNPQTAETDGTQRKPHMFWVDNNEGHLGMLESTDDTTKDTPVLGNNSVLNIDYSNVNTNILNADLYTHTSDDSKILSYGNDDTNKLELQQSAVDIGVKDCVLCFVPNPKVAYTEPAMIALTLTDEENHVEDENTNGDTSSTDKPLVQVTEQQTDIENSLGIDTYIPTNTDTETEEDTKVKNNVSMGGTFKFALPNLAFKNTKSQADKGLYNTKQFVKFINKSEDPISVTLKKVSLNNNENINDNTSYGWRYYLDNSLLASPINDFVYVGTNNSLLSTNIGEKIYKANIVISAIQYRIGYNSSNELAFRQGTWLRDKTIGGKDYTPAVLEQNYIDWYKLCVPQPMSLSKGTFYKRYNSDITYTTDNIPYYFNDSRITLFVETEDKTTSIPSGFTLETKDDGSNTAVYYTKVEKWEDRNFKYKTTVTDVIYYIIPTPQDKLNDGEVDIFNIINGKDTDDKLVCMRYRLFFKSKKEENENVDSIFYYPIHEPTENKSNLCTPLDLNNKNNIYQLGVINNYQNLYFIRDNVTIDLGTKTKIDNATPLQTDKTYLHPTKESVEREVGKYNDFKWCSGQIVLTVTPVNTEINSIQKLVYCRLNKERCAPSCGRMLPQNATTLNSVWVLQLNETADIPSSKQYEFYTLSNITDDGQEVKVNTLSNNLLNDDFSSVSICTVNGTADFIYILEKDNGWYINDRRIVTEPVNTEKIIYDKYIDTFGF